jgi:hypothetical protein
MRERLTQKVCEGAQYLYDSAVNRGRPLRKRTRAIQKEHDAEPGFDHQRAGPLHRRGV